MKRRVCLLSLIVVALTGMAQARTYKIGVTGWTGWSPTHVAEAKGFWQEQGLDVKVFTFPGNIAVDAALKNKRIDIGFEMLGTAVGLYLEGVPVVIIAETDWSHGGDKIIVKQEGPAADLKAKPIGVYLNQPSVTYFLKHYLASLGLKLADVRVVEMETGQLADKFISGLFNTIVSYDPAALRAEREGKGKVVATSATYEGCIPEGMLALKDNLQTIPPADLAGIFKGWVKAVQWSQDPAHRKEYMDILITQTFKGSTPYSEQDLQAMMAAVRIHDPNMQLLRNRDGGGLQTYLSDLKAFLAANQMLKKDFTVKELFDNKAIVEVLSQP